MSSTTLAFLLAAAAIVLVLAIVRRGFALRGSGRLAQLEFKRRYGAEVARRLHGAPDPRGGSPWIAIRVGDRPARLVAAPLGRGGELQAGVELLDHELPVQVYLTDGDPNELALLPGIELDAVLPLVARLAELGVENVASPGPGGTHVLRIHFRDLAQLAERLRQVAPVLAELERLAERPERG